MAVIGLTADGKKIVLVSVPGPSSYTSGGFTVTVPELAKVHAVLSAFITGGYKIGDLIVSDNNITVSIHYYDYPATSPGLSVEVPAGTNLSRFYVTLVVVGI